MAVKLSIRPVTGRACARPGARASRSLRPALAGMRRALWPTVWLLVVALLAAGFSVISGLEFWWAFLIVAAATLINGWVATLEDDLPGGFNNPDGTRTGCSRHLSAHDEPHERSGR